MGKDIRSLKFWHWSEVQFPREITQTDLFTVVGLSTYKAYLSRRIELNASERNIVSILRWKETVAKDDGWMEKENKGRKVWEEIIGGRIACIHGFTLGLYSYFPETTERMSKGQGPWVWREAQQLGALSAHTQPVFGPSTCIRWLTTVCI